MEKALTLKIYILILILFSFSLFLSFQNSSLYNDILIFFNDPLHTIPVLALNYTAKSLNEYFNIKKVKAYTEYPLSIDAAFNIAKERDLKYLLEIKTNLLNYSRTSSGYSVKIEVITSSYILNDYNPKNTAIDTGISENALSLDIAFAYALYDGSIKAINKIEKEFLALIQK